MSAHVIKQKMQSAGMGSPYLIILATMLLLFSLYLLSYPLVVVMKSDPVQQNTPKVKKQQEHLVQLFTLPEQQAQPEEEEAVATDSSNTPTSKGKKPAIDASFAMPVRNYVKILQRSGAKLILFDSQRGRVIGEVVDMHLKTDGIKLHGMSMRARDITIDLPYAFRDKVRAQVGGRSRPYKFLIVLPTQAEQQFEQRLANQLSSLGISWSAISSIKLRYEQSDTRINARIESINFNGKVRRVGTTIEVW